MKFLRGTHRPLKLTKRGEITLAIVALVWFLIMMAVVGGIERGTL